MIEGGQNFIILSWSVALLVLLLMAWLNHPFGKNKE